MELYDHKKIEAKWQKQWEKDGLYRTTEKPKKKKYILDMFPYPSGAGLHVGHPEGYTATDILSRFMRMNGHDVLHPMGWDAFGLPAENYAIKQGVAPAKSTAENIKRFTEQIKSIGLSYDWEREISTAEPKYYLWTQWLFLQLYKKGLAYKKEAYVNWCPKDQTVLANEQVVDGCCDRCGTKVEQKLLNQWFFKITDYAERLLNDLDKLDWPEPIKAMQRNWIGKSEGAEIDFEVQAQNNFVILHGFEGSPEKPAYAWLRNQIKARGHEVVLPALPNSFNPKEEEQVDYVLKNVKFDKNTILYGKSLGSVVALKVLEKLKEPIAGLVLAGGFLEGNKLHKKYPFDKTFKWQYDFEKIKKNVGFVRILNDLSDQIAVPIEQGRLLHKQLGGLLVETTSIEQHFLAEKEPAILDIVLPKIKVFTTRPDTLYSGTFLVLAPDHQMAGQLTTPEQKQEIEKYTEITKGKTELERTALEKDKTGAFTGSYAINPASGDKMPIWIADFVLSNYGTGAVFADAHDERDFAFAKKYKIPLKTTLKPKDGSDDSKIRNLEVCFTEKGILYDSGEFSGLTSEEAIPKIGKKFGKLVTKYKIRDWLVSRQRYWGAPIPIIYCDDCGMQAVPEKDLPVELPTDVDFLPTGESPIARSKTFHKVKCPNCGKPARRDSDTMDTFVDSSWYYFRFTDPHNDKAWVDKKKLKEWMPVDVYVGGAEHAVLHLLYSRFITKAFHDLGFVEFEEPFMKLRNQGLILGPDGEKMSKSRGNVINPDEVITEWGADAFRMYEMFMGPLEDTKPWSTTGIIGLKRFLDKVWRYNQVFEAQADNKDIHKLIQKVTSDIENFKFNTAIAAFMGFLNENKQMSQANWESFLILLAPFAPHITEELWKQLKHKDSIHLQPWPKFDEKLVVDETVTIVVQVLGRIRASLEFSKGIDQKTVKELALKDANVAKHLAGKEIVKEVFVQDKLINFVVK